MVKVRIAQEDCIDRSTAGSRGRLRSKFQKLRTQIGGCIHQHPSAFIDANREATLGPRFDQPSVCASALRAPAIPLRHPAPRSRSQYLYHHRFASDKRRLRKYDFVPLPKVAASLEAAVLDHYELLKWRIVVSQSIRRRFKRNRNLNKRWRVPTSFVWAFFIKLVHFSMSF